MDVDNLRSIAISEEVLVFSGKVIAENVSYEDYLSERYGEHVEWLYGVVIAMSPVSVRHDLLEQFLIIVFRTYLELTTGGVVLRDPVVMRASPDLLAREPDIQVILPDRMDYLQENQMAGPANLVVEIVSRESVQRDRGEKFKEYEQGGVNEYWIIDPVRKEALFYGRAENELYQSRLPVDGVYTSQVLHQLKLPVDVLWQEKLPTTREAVQMVERMLEQATE